MWTEDATPTLLVAYLAAEASLITCRVEALRHPCLLCWLRRFAATIRALLTFSTCIESQSRSINEADGIQCRASTTPLVPKGGGRVMEGTASAKAGEAGRPTIGRRDMRLPNALSSRNKGMYILMLLTAG